MWQCGMTFSHDKSHACSPGSWTVDSAKTRNGSNCARLSSTHESGLDCKIYWTLFLNTWSTQLQRNFTWVTDISERHWRVPCPLEYHQLQESLLQPTTKIRWWRTSWITWTSWTTLPWTPLSGLIRTYIYLAIILMTAPTHIHSYSMIFGCLH